MLPFLFSNYPHRQKVIEFCRTNPDETIVQANVIEDRVKKMVSSEKSWMIILKHLAFFNFIKKGTGRTIQAF